MAEASIPVDLFNPGQVFASIGFAEAADILLGGAEGVFDWSNEGRVCFLVRAKGDVSPVRRVLEFLEQAQATAIAPAGSLSLEGWIDTWGEKPSAIDPGLGYPFPSPSSPATYVCRLSDGANAIDIDHWGDATERDNVKFWAGARGYPGSALARDALALVRGRAVAAARDPFSLSAPQSSSFRLDWRRDYIPIHAGFSLNAHEHIETLGFPVVELLAAIGLGNARPSRPRRRDKLAYEYSVVGRENAGDSTWLPLSLLRAGLGGAPLQFPTRRFRMLLDWPGQEGQARAITSVTEETAV